MDGESVQAVAPREEDGKILCECGSWMYLTFGDNVDSTYGWLFWTCQEGHATEAFPVPLAIL